MGYQITRKLTFCAAHRVRLHESKCRHLHGHNYTVFLTAGCDTLDDAGRVIDFGVLKRVCGGWLDEALDHGLIYEGLDNECESAALVMGEQKVYVMDCPPTAENLAEMLLDVFNSLLSQYGVKVTKVVLWETENCYAEAHA
jgi:6-pyruvoyltetrahydropterin/6-carboxytetrahydropterin synthase